MARGKRSRNYSFQPGLCGGGTIGDVTSVILICKNSFQLASITIFQKTILWNSLPHELNLQSLERNSKAVSLSTKPINKEKLNYSDILEHAPYEKEKVEKKSSFSKILKDFMKKHSFSFERFVFPVNCLPDGL